MPRLFAAGRIPARRSAPTVTTHNMTMTNSAYVRRVAKQFGLLVSVSGASLDDEIRVECRDGHCWAHDCHERVFTGDTLAECWEIVREEIDWLASHQTPCAPDTCPGWCRGAESTRPVLPGEEAEWAVPQCEYWGPATAPSAS